MDKIQAFLITAGRKDLAQEYYEKTSAVTKGLFPANNTVKLEQLIKEHNHPELAKEPMVYQVWNDGEVTLQKGGDLLWQRTLHLIEQGYENMKVDKNLFPEQHGGNGFIFTTEEGAQEISQFITKMPHIESPVEKYFKEKKERELKSSSKNIKANIEEIETELIKILHQNNMEYQKLRDGRYIVWKDGEDAFEAIDKKFENKLKKVIAPLKKVYLDAWNEESGNWYPFLAIEEDEE